MVVFLLHAWSLLPIQLNFPSQMQSQFWWTSILSCHCHDYDLTRFSTTLWDRGSHQLHLKPIIKCPTFDLSFHLGLSRIRCCKFLPSHNISYNTRWHWWSCTATWLEYNALCANFQIQALALGSAFSLCASSNFQIQALAVCHNVLIGRYFEIALKATKFHCHSGVSKSKILAWDRIGVVAWE